MEPGPRRILIVEEALHSRKGHWFEYVRTIAEECRRRGDDVCILAHKEADRAIVEELGARPVLPCSAWTSRSRPRGFFSRHTSILHHNLRLYRAVDRVLRAEEKWDCILAPTILLDHLIAWTLLAHKYRSHKYSRMALVFINGRGKYQGAGQPVAFPRHPKNLLFRFLLRRLRPMVETGEVILASEAEGMVKEFAAFSGLPFRHLPHPVEFDLPPRRPEGASRSLTFSCFGFARHEKGSDILQEAILAIRERRPELRLQFLVQWVDDFAMPDGRCVSRDPRLLADPGVTYITDAIDAATYRRHLARTDAMILPYRASSYYARVSRVAIEAAIAGLPMVYTRHTWVEDLVGRCGAGVAFQDENMEDLVRAIVELAERIEPLAQLARERAPLARKFHAAANYRTGLLAAAPAPGFAARGEAEASCPSV